MQYHPHGDASIGDMVQIGQKELLIDCQGNWGNILTGDGAQPSDILKLVCLNLLLKFYILKLQIGVFHTMVVVQSPTIFQLNFLTISSRSRGNRSWTLDQSFAS
jgi:hypothetical protein